MERLSLSVEKDFGLLYGGFLNGKLNFTTSQDI